MWLKRHNFLFESTEKILDGTFSVLGWNRRVGVFWGVESTRKASMTTFQDPIFKTLFSRLSLNSLTSVSTLHKDNRSHESRCSSLLHDKRETSTRCWKMTPV